MSSRILQLGVVRRWNSWIFISGSMSLLQALPTRIESFDQRLETLHGHLANRINDALETAITREREPYKQDCIDIKATIEALTRGKDGNDITLQQLASALNSTQKEFLSQILDEDSLYYRQNIFQFPLESRNGKPSRDDVRRIIQIDELIADAISR